MKKNVLVLLVMLFITCITIAGCDSGDSSKDSNVPVHSVCLRNASDENIYNVTLDGENHGFIRDGDYELVEVPAGIYHLYWSYLGYLKSDEIEISTACGRICFIDIYSEWADAYCDDENVIIWNKSSSTISDVSINGGTTTEIYNDEGWGAEIVPGNYYLDWTFNSTNYSIEIFIPECNGYFEIEIYGSDIGFSCN